MVKTALPPPPAAPPCAKKTRDLAGFGGGERPVILQRTDQDFVEAVLEELKTPAGRTKMLAGQAAARDASLRLRLFQPVHRTFHMALFEAFCDELGHPRLDPAKVESAGLVVRRVLPSSATAGSADAHTWGWMRDGNRIAGWVPMDTTQLRDRDPDPARRPPPLKAGHPEITRRLSILLGLNSMEETVSPLFVAPPEVCRAAGRTVLYGMIPVASTEVSEATQAAPDYPEDDVKALLPAWLKAGTYSWRSREELEPPVDGATGMTKRDELSLLSNIGFFSDTDAARALRTAMDRVTVHYGTPTTVFGQTIWPVNAPLGNELWVAHDSMENERAAKRYAAASTYAVTGADAKAILDAARGMLITRMGAAKPSQTRFELRGGVFRVRAFARVKRCGDCPPELVWSEPSEPFTIVPWYESGDLPPVRVALPEATADSFRKMKPNVTFVTPQSVADMMQGMGLKDLSEGKGKAPGSPGLGLDWLCSFSIPIITLCAFIVLQIFLALLNIIFWWLPIVKICIPIPKLTPPEER